MRRISRSEEEQAYRTRSPERISTTFRQPNKIEFSLLDELREGLDRLFDRDVWIHSCAFEEVELFEAFEVFVDVVNASAQVFWAEYVCQMDGYGVWVRGRTKSQGRFYPPRDLPRRELARFIRHPAAEPLG